MAFIATKTKGPQRTRRHEDPYGMMNRIRRDQEGDTTRMVSEKRARQRPSPSIAESRSRIGGYSGIVTITNNDKAVV